MSDRATAIRDRVVPWLLLVGLWVGLALAVEAITTRVVDWYYMTDELLYERLAISVARSGSPLPELHGRLVGVVDQLYPALIALVYRHGLVPHDLREAHALNAWVMTSAAIPAFLLARRTTRAWWVSYAVALLTVCVPWIVYSSFLLTEVAAYPLFLWAMLALHATMVRPSRRNDVLVVLAIAAAVLARTQFVVLLLVVPAVLALGDRRAALERHRVLVALYAVMVAVVAALLVAGRATSALGIYSDSVHGSVLSGAIVRALLDHTSTLALGLGILPFVVGVGWLLETVVRPQARDETHAFAVLALVTTLVVLAEGAIFDVRNGGGVVRDRYVFYVAPLVLIAFFQALREGAPRRFAWLLVPLAVVIAGFVVAPVPVYGRLDIGSPVAVSIVYLRTALHSAEVTRVFLVATAIVLVLLYVEGRALLRRGLVAAVLAVLTVAVIPAETSYAFLQLLRHNGTAGRPVTVEQGGVFDWIDRTVGPDAAVTMVPYPTLQTDAGASVAFWWDLEFWNKAVVRDAQQADEFVGTPSTFPKVELRFDPATGRANVSPTRYVAEYGQDVRFRVSGTAVSFTRDTLLIDAGKRWRADWITLGLADDGWTRPHRPATIRVFSFPGQKGAVTRSLSLGVQAPFTPTLVAAQPFAVVSNLGAWKAIANGGDHVEGTLEVCVPAGGFADVRLTTPGVHASNADSRERRVGVLLTDVSLADEVGAPCSPSRNVLRRRSPSRS